MYENLYKNFSVVIRSASERTVEVCNYIIKKELPAGVKMTTIELQPFEAALRKSYELGIQSKKKWLVIVDADVLPKYGAIQNLIGRAEKSKRNIIQLEGYLYDGILLKYRMGGIKIYRCDLLNHAIKMIPENGSVIRPESYTLRKMNEKGWRRKILYVVTGLHDFEQFRKDLYRKSYIHAVKHRKEIIEKIPVWADMANSDDDYKIIMQGVFDGLLDQGSAKIDTRDFKTSSVEALEKLKISEKSAEINFKQIEKKIVATLNSLDPLFPPVSVEKVKYHLKYYGFKETSHHFIKSVAKKIFN